MRSLHLELTTRCVLECPGCPRTWFANTIHQNFPNQDLDHDLLRKFLDCSLGDSIETFHLESNHGDCIYYPKLIDFLKEWRQSKKFQIVTNGSRRKPQFWHELNSVLTADDEITFSVDGLKETNHLYRKNSDWDSLIEAIKISTQGPARIVWKTIVFSHNQDDLKTIENFAMDHGVDEFKLVKTHRFGDDKLIPRSDLIDTPKIYQNCKTISKISPQCGRNSHQTFIVPNGYCWPCCWITSYFTLHKTNLWKNRHMFDMRENSFDQIINQIDLFAMTIANSPKDAHSVCRMMCGNG